MKRSFLLIGLIAIACRTRPVPDIRPAAAPLPDDRGTVAAKLIDDPNAPSARLAPGEEYLPPQITPGNPLPTYPTDLVKLHLPQQVIVMRMTVDESRHVTSVAPSPIQPSTESAYRPRFEESVRSTLQQWSVWPPRIRKFKGGPDGDGDGKPDYQVLVDERILKVYFDLAFTFDVVNGEAVVRSAAVTR